MQPDDGNPLIKAVGAGAVLLSGKAGEPIVAVARGPALRGIVALPELGSRGAYMVEWQGVSGGRPEVYVGGTSRSIAERLRARRGPEPVRLLAVAPSAELKSRQHGFAVERFAWTDVSRTGRADVLNLEPPRGNPLPVGELRRALSSWQTAVRWLSPFLDYLAPSAFAPWCVREPSPRAPGRIARLQRGDLDATAVVDADGWTVLAGSLIRSSAAPSSGPGQAVLRLELGLADLLGRTSSPAVCRLGADVWRPSRSAATVFVTGSRGTAVSAWEFSGCRPRSAGALDPDRVVVPFPAARRAPD
ncbi:hypothetical protein WDZ92_30305 [Nostoc sp. NIES-2111]